MSRNKEELALLAKGHNEEAFNELYEMLWASTSIRAMAMIKGSPNDVDEVTTEATSRIPQFLEKWAPSQSTFATFYETCSRNAMINAIKRNKSKRVSYSSELPDPPYEQPDDDFSLEGLIGITSHADIAVEAIKSLSPSQRQIVEFVIQGHTVKEISEALEATESEVRSRLKATVNYIMFEIRANDPGSVGSIERKAFNPNGSS